MEKMKMKTDDLAQENFEKLRAMFPEAVTETLDDEGNLVRGIDADQLRQAISQVVVEGNKERYQMTWPGKREAIRLANAPIDKTLRPCREESVDFDTTQNLYIEGDNLDVLKLLRETYLGKVKMIYIDPPYNTGNDFIYNDDFRQDADDYLEGSGQKDEEGNRMVQNLVSNGRFHSDWLSMIYPRLKLAKDLLRDDGAIFIHIDENEVSSLLTICKEIFGENNELGTIIWDKRNPKGESTGVAYQHESILVFCKNKLCFSNVSFTKKKEHAQEMILKVQSLIEQYNGVTDIVRTKYTEWIRNNASELSGGERAYNKIDATGNIYQPVSMAAPDDKGTRSHRPLIHPITRRECPVPARGWRFTDTKMNELLQQDKIVFGNDETTQPRQKYLLKDYLYESVSSLIYYGGCDTPIVPFDNPKPLTICMKMIYTICKNPDDIALDFFSGSATTAHAVMQLNAERMLVNTEADSTSAEVKLGGGSSSGEMNGIKFIMVQLPEVCNEKSEAYKAGYKNICEIGKERIRRAGAKIKAENPLLTKDLDTGFRVLKIDSSNMEDVYYNPNDLSQADLFNQADNIKPDRSHEDLLFQVMLELGIELSSPIEKIQEGKYTFYNVAETHLLACFDENITEKVVEKIAEYQPVYAVFRDNGFKADSTAINFDQIFKSHSPDTECRVL